MGEELGRGGSGLRGPTSEIISKSGCAPSRRSTPALAFREPDLLIINHINHGLNAVFPSTGKGKFPFGVNTCRIDKGSIQ